MTLLPYILNISLSLPIKYIKSRYVEQSNHSLIGQVKRDE